VKEHYWKLTIKGGPGSGHWGHAGRPGKIGGSLPGNVAVSIATGRTAVMRHDLLKRGRHETQDHPDFRFLSVAVRDGDVQPNEFDAVLEIERIAGAKRYVENFIRENRELVGQLDDDGLIMDPDRNIAANIVFTTDKADAGMGSASSDAGIIKVFYAPYDAEKAGWESWRKDAWEIDPLFVATHELHHAYGSLTELDILSDVMAVGYHLELGNTLNPSEVNRVARGWLQVGTDRVAGKDWWREHVVRSRKAFRWLYDTNPEYAKQIMSEYADPEKLERKIRRW